MGIMAMDYPPDFSIASGASTLIANTPVVEEFLTPEQLEERHSLYRGSGGVLTNIFSGSVTGSKTVVVKVPYNKIAAATDEVCSAFGLTKVEFAELCHIESRKSLYNWIKGESTPRKATMRRIFDLLTVSQAWQHAGFSNNKHELRQVTLDGQSLFDILNQDKIDLDLVLFVGSRLNIMPAGNTSIRDPFSG
ncbi:hypothetical protein N9J88_02415 [Porticoccaceae bacterium]|nr:hypothetical protein [Porticoccaceae bacterium]